MKKVTKLLMVALLAGRCGFVYAQQYMNAPSFDEKIIGTTTVGELYEGSTYIWWSKDGWYRYFLDNARQNFLNKSVEVRNMILEGGKGDGWYHGPASCNYVVKWDVYIKSCLSQATRRSLGNVREGSRVAIDWISVSGLYVLDKDIIKDQLIDVLLDKGYKIVAKEYLEKLYQELQDQQSGIYNDRTTVQENNFSAVGYYINVKVTESSLRMQVVNVSTGEYEGNATINYSTSFNENKKILVP